MNRQQAGLLLSLVCALGGCQASDGNQSGTSAVDAALERMDVRLGTEQTSISNFTLNGFRAIDDSNLVVTSGTQEHYLVTLAAPCFGLPYAFGVRFETRTSNITSFDHIVVNDLNGRPERCQISRIYSLESAAGNGD